MVSFWFESIRDLDWVREGVSGSFRACIIGWWRSKPLQMKLPVTTSLSSPGLAFTLLLLKHFFLSQYSQTHEILEWSLFLKNLFRKQWLHPPIHTLALIACVIFGIARRSNKSILKEINPEWSSEGLMLKLKRQYLILKQDRRYEWGVVAALTAGNLQWNRPTVREFLFPRTCHCEFLEWPLF